MEKAGQQQYHVGIPYAFRIWFDELVQSTTEYILSCCESQKVNAQLLVLTIARARCAFAAMSIVIPSVVPPPESNSFCYGSTAVLFSMFMSALASPMLGTRSQCEPVNLLQKLESLPDPYFRESLRCLRGALLQTMQLQDSKAARHPELAVLLHRILQQVTLSVEFRGNTFGVLCNPFCSTIGVAPRTTDRGDICLGAAVTPIHPSHAPPCADSYKHYFEAAQRYWNASGDADEGFLQLLGKDLRPDSFTRDALEFGNGTSVARIETQWTAQVHGGTAFSTTGYRLYHAPALLHPQLVRRFDALLHEALVAFQRAAFRRHLGPLGCFQIVALVHLHLATLVLWRRGSAAIVEVLGAALLRYLDVCFSNDGNVFVAPVSPLPFIQIDFEAMLSSGPRLFAFRYPTYWCWSRADCVACGACPFFDNRASSSCAHSIALLQTPAQRVSPTCSTFHISSPNSASQPVWVAPVVAILDSTCETRSSDRRVLRAPAAYIHGSRVLHQGEASQCMCGQCATYCPSVQYVSLHTPIVIAYESCLRNRGILRGGDRFADIRVASRGRILTEMDFAVVPHSALRAKVAAIVDQTCFSHQCEFSISGPSGQSMHVIVFVTLAALPAMEFLHQHKETFPLLHHTICCSPVFKNWSQLDCDVFCPSSSHCCGCQSSGVFLQRCCQVAPLPRTLPESAPAST